MIWFEYKFWTFSELINSVKLFSEYSIKEYSILVASVFLLILCIYYIIPFINICINYIVQKRKKRKRKELIKQIAMQKDINEEIEKELNIL
mgnify:CR=1 FL=1